MNTTRILGYLVLALIVITGVHWYFNSRPTAYFNTYGSEIVGTSTDSMKAEDTAKVGTKSSQNVPGQSSASGVVSVNNSSKNFMHTVTIQTNKGVIVFETYDADAPKTVENFITLANKGFYDGLIFHRVIRDFMIQGGDPTGTGMGGPGYKFADELDPATPSYKTGYVRGAVAMANAGPNTNGSQFFIMHKDTPLPHNYTIFGRVVSGMEVVDAIAAVATGAADKPVQDVVMTKVSVASK